MTTVADSHPYPWPYDGHFDPARTALVACGVQAGIAHLCGGSATALAAVHDVAHAVRAAGGLVVWVRHGTRAAVRTTPLPVLGTAGHDLVVEPGPGDVVVDAAGWDGCFASDLDHVLRRSGTTTVVLAGLGSEVTVDSTVRTLNDRGHECLVLTDACAGVDPDLAARAQHSLTMSGGIFGALGTSSALLEAIATETADPVAASKELP